MTRSRIRTASVALLACAGLALPAVLASSPAEARRATTGKVVFVADGDTIDVDVAGDSSGRGMRVRYIGVQAMELRVYSHTLKKLRGDCWGVEAAKNLHALINHKQVQLNSRHESSHSTRNWRPRRSVAVLQGGKWVDTGALQITAGLALPDLIPDEYTHNLDYMRRAQEAAANGVGMWGDPTHCGVGPSQEVPLSVHINWDAYGNDGANVNGEWIDITNNGSTAVPLGGWWIRDAAYRGTKAHGYEFPANAVVQPGSRLRLKIGHGNDDSNTLFWGLSEPIFANVTNAPRWMGDGAWLFDPQGDLRSWDMYPCRYGC
jgi:micrococcal nuclease